LTESLNKALMSARAIADAMETLRTFCQEVEHQAKTAALRHAAAEQTQLVRDLNALVDHVFLHEGRDPLVDLPPDAEILRRSSGSPDEFTERPIFLVGSRRSGTTLVLHLINAGLKIAALPESFVGAALTECEALIQSGMQVKRTLDEPFPRYLRRLGQFADAVYLAHAVRSGKRRWASKEGSAWPRLDILDAMFDYRAKFVYVVRHGFDVCWSSATRFPMRDGLPLGRTGLSVATYLDQWVANNEGTMDFVERNPERSFILRYEDLTAQPELWGRRLFEFVEQEWDEDVFLRMEKQKLSKMGDNKIFRTGGKILNHAAPVWTEWPRALKAQLGRRANPTLVRLGYEPVRV